MNKLISKDILQELIANEERSQQGVSELDMVPVVKLFTPDAGATWVIVTGAKTGDDLIMFGWCDLGVGFPEYGTVSLNEILAVRGVYGLPVERDRFFSTDLSLQEWVEEQNAEASPDNDDCGRFCPNCACVDPKLVWTTSCDDIQCDNCGYSEQ